MLDTRYSTLDKKGTKYHFTLIFPFVSPGVKVIDIIEPIEDGFYWIGVEITNPAKDLSTDWSDFTLKAYWENYGIDAIEGIYESINSNLSGNKYTLAVKKYSEDYKLIYLTGDNSGKWEVGDIKGILTPTASTNVYKAEWYMSNMSTSENLYITFETNVMKVLWTDGRQESFYLKLYPTSSSFVSSSPDVRKSGTGFAISSNGYIVTNQHVTDGAKKIKVRGVKGDFSKSYNAEVVVEDKNNDLAIIKINDSSFTTLGTPPYMIKQEIVDAGNPVYTLGYPLRATMGDEIKLTDGIVSSKTGFQGDITTYQITVPVQPGNSGGPLFNQKGDVIGVINAKHTNTDNVSYAIKTNYLFNLMQVMDYEPILSVNNTISSMKLSDQVKFIKEFVYILEIN